MAPIMPMHKHVWKMTLCSWQPQQIQMLQNFSDYLLDVEEKMVVTEGKDDKANGEKHETGNTVPVAAGAGDSNICGGIIQLHWDQILERCLDLKELVRQAALKVISFPCLWIPQHPCILSEPSVCPGCLSADLDVCIAILWWSLDILSEICWNQRAPRFQGHKFYLWYIMNSSEP